MKRSRKRCIALLAITLPALLIAVPIVATMRIVRQDQLNQALIVAVKANDTRRVVALLNRGADANARDDGHPSVTFWQRLTSLFRGSKPSTADTPLLIALGYSDKPDAHGRDTWRPENVPLVRALLDHKADVNVIDSMNWTPLALAIEGSDNETILLLVTRGARIQADSNQLHAPLVEAAGNPFIDLFVLQYLLDHGADVNQRDDRGETALFRATIIERSDTVKLLLSRHADVTLTYEFGDTPLSIALKAPADSECRHIVRLLKQAGEKR